MIKLPDGLPDMRVFAVPTNGAKFAENQKIAAEIASKHPGKVAIVRDKTQFKPTDVCERFADLLVDPVTHELRPEILKLSAAKFSTEMVKKHGPRYKLSDKWQSQERPTISKKTLAVTASKVMDRLRSHKVTLPIPNVDKLSFNDLRKYLLGTGSNQPNMITLNTLVAFHPDKVLIGNAVWHWRDAFGRKANVQVGSFLQSTTDDKLSMSRLCSLLGLTEEEILKKCYSMSDSPA